MKNRWLMVLSAIGIHISIGSVYAFSVITDPVKTIFNVDASVVKWAFQIAILVMGFSAAFLGQWVTRMGPKRSTTIAGVCYGIGILGTGLALQLQSLFLFYVAYGLVAGIGLGVGYITPVSVLVKWFPDRRGLAVGIVIMAFGLASMVFGPLMQYLFETIGVTSTFYSLGVIYTLLILLAASYIENPPEGYRPKGFKLIKTKSTTSESIDFTVKQALKSKRFYYIWIMMFINITCGIALIAEASQISQFQLGYTPMQAAGVVGLIGAFNGLGRIFWSAFSDFFGRPITFIIFFLIQMIAFFFLAQIGQEFLFLGVLMLIITIYGGAFATLPAFLSDLFGTKQLGTILGVVLISKGFAGLLGPAIYDYVKTTTGSLDITLKVFSGLFVLAFLIAIAMQFSVKKSQKLLQSEAV
ncbi:OFA family MFS transporter [Winogradskyella sp.]|uniref:L-lactate MFS transporter n=1 Tax=Winogradskyella sp. TaxID=1883156 RepID=UPI00260F6E5A|nr:OFA family MFS transporter [Winogradskyella sp.]